MQIAAIAFTAIALAFVSLHSDAKSGKPSTGTGAKASSTSVRGHVTKKSSYVQPHRKTTRDKSKTNNYSTKGNVNPYTGKKGSK